MMELSGSFGSSSPKTRPESVSKVPALPKVAPPKAGEVLTSTMNRTTRADAGTANDAARSTTRTLALRNCMRPPACLISMHSGRRHGTKGSVAARGAPENIGESGRRQEFSSRELYRFEKLGV